MIKGKIIGILAVFALIIISALALSGKIEEVGVYSGYYDCDGGDDIVSWNCFKKVNVFVPDTDDDCPAGFHREKLGVYNGYYDCDGHDDKVSWNCFKKVDVCVKNWLDSPDENYEELGFYNGYYDCDGHDDIVSWNCFVKKKVLVEEPYEPECEVNSDCGEDGYVGSASCSNNDLFQDYRTYICNNPGTSEASCSHTDSSLLKQDCGEDIYSENYCKGDDVYRDFTDRGCDNAECFEKIHQQRVEECEFGCENGECKEEPVIACYQNSDCGSQHWKNTQLCQQDDVFDYWVIPKCANPATIDAYCYNQENLQLKTDCGEDYCDAFGSNYCEDNDVYHKKTCYDKGCLLGACFNNNYQEEGKVQECGNAGCSNGACNIACFNDGDCDDSNLYTKDTCINPGTPESYCSYEDIACYQNSDCGTDGFINEASCVNNGVHQDYRTYTCNNPGTSEASCTYNDTEKEKQHCGQDYCDNWGENYCEGGDLWHSKICHNIGCFEGECYDAPFPEVQEVQDCEFECENGFCLPEPKECTSDGECDDSLFCNGVEKCVNNKCQQGVVIDCSAFNLPGIETCDNNPDSNPLTWDFFPEFISSCNEASDSCTLGNLTLSNKYEIGKCGVECLEDEDCNEDEECEDYKCEEEEEEKKKAGGGRRKILINYCGDGICDEEMGENELNCIEDCELVQITSIKPKKEKIELEGKFSIKPDFKILILIILVVLVVFLVWLVSSLIKK